VSGQTPHPPFFWQTRTRSTSSSPNAPTPWPTRWSTPNRHGSAPSGQHPSTRPPGRRGAPRSPRALPTKTGDGAASRSGHPFSQP